MGSIQSAMGLDKNRNEITSSPALGGDGDCCCSEEGEETGSVQVHSGDEDSVWFNVVFVSLIAAVVWSVQSTDRNFFDPLAQTSVSMREGSKSSSTPRLFDSGWPSSRAVFVVSL